MNKNKLDIFYIIGDLNLGGTEKHLLNILPEIQKKGIKIYLYTFKEKGTLYKEFVNKGIEVRTVIFSNLIKILPNLFKKPLGLIINVIQIFLLLNFYKPKILHMYLPEAYIIGSVASILNKNLYKIMSRRSKNYYFETNKAYKKIECFFHKKTNLLLGNSNSVCLDLYEECSNNNKIKLIYNGIKIPSTNKFNVSVDKVASIKNKYKINKKAIIVTLVANLIPYKNHIFLINSTKELIKKLNNNVQFLFIGEDRGIKNNLINLINKNNLQKSFLFFENFKETSDFYLISDINLLCSLHEGFSNAILESMSFGLPVIASNVGGNSEAVFHNQNGFLFDLNDANSFKNYLKILIQDQEIRYNFGKKSLNIVKENFDIDYCVANYHKAYNIALNKEKTF